MSGGCSEELRRECLAAAAQMQEANRLAEVSGERIVLPLPDRSIDVVWYAARTARAPLLLAFHGGGFLFGGNALNEAMWRALCDALDVNVASIGYRKSPDYKFRAGLEDAFDALRYFRAHAGAFGFDTDRIWAMGCSAGANLAATLCIYAKQRGEAPIRGQLLFYPVLDFGTDPAAKGDGSLAQPLQYLFDELHFDPEDARDPLLSPLYAAPEAIAGLPEAVFFPAAHDSLKTEALRYAEMLRAAGVKTEVHLAEDMPHGFFEVGFGQVSAAELKILGPEVETKVRDGSIAAYCRETLETLRSLLSEA